MLPAGILRKLDDDAMAEYRRPFLNRGEDRRPTLTWPRQVPIDGVPPEVVKVATAYSDWLSTSAVPKLHVQTEPGLLDAGKSREFSLTWPNQRVVSVKGVHFVQEDSPVEAGLSVGQVWSASSISWELSTGGAERLSLAAEGDRAGGHGEVAARRVKRVSTRPIQHKESTMTSTAQPTQPTTSQDMVVGTFDTQGQAEQVVRRLIDAGVQPTHISILAQNLELREQVQGYIATGDVARGGAMTGAWMGGLFGLLAGTAAFLWVPVFGPLIFLGPLATAAVGALEGGAVGGLLGAILGKQVEKDHVTKIQAALQGGKYVVVVHNTSPQELDLARRVMGEQGGQDVSTFPARAA